MDHRLACLAVLAAAGCEVLFPLDDAFPRADPFVGCFNGPFTEPQGGTLTVVIEKAGADSLMGCFRASGAQGIAADFAGTVDPDQQSQALVTVVQATRSFTLKLTRSPADSTEPAVTMNVEDAGNAPFTSALNLTRCAAATSCTVMSKPQPFVPVEVP